MSGLGTATKAYLVAAILVLGTHLDGGMVQVFANYRFIRRRT